MRRTHPGECSVDKRLDTFKALHVVTQPNLNDLVLRYRGSNSVEYFSKSRKTDSSQVLACTGRLCNTPCDKSYDTNPVYPTARSSRTLELAPVLSLHTQVH